MKTPACRYAESTRRDGRNAGLFELAGGLDRYLGTRIGDLAQRCHDLDGYPSALGAGDQSREHLFVLSADLPVGDTLADLSAQLVLGCTFHFGLGLRGGPTRGRGGGVLHLAAGAQRKRKGSGGQWRRSGGFIVRSSHGLDGPLFDPLRDRALPYAHQPWARVVVGRPEKRRSHAWSGARFGHIPVTDRPTVTEACLRCIRSSFLD